MYFLSVHRLVYQQVVFPLPLRIILLFYGFLLKIVVFWCQYLVLFNQSVEKEIFYNPMMDQLRHHNPGQKSPGQHDGAEFEGYMMDSSDYANTNINPMEHNVSEAKPVLNYSLQTGEEFALEFMLDRVNPRKHFVTDTGGDPSQAPGYVELNGILGISQTGTEGSSDISMLSLIEKGSNIFDQKSSSLHNNKSKYGSSQVFPSNSSDYSNYHTLSCTSSGLSDSSSSKLKVLCSFGGKILPRPSDGKLRYVGGETRIIRIRKDIEWQELWQKAQAVYGHTQSIKYQLPGEDLDALVSVSSDEDLQNMMDECNVVEDGDGFKKLRLFLFSINDLRDAHFSLASSDVDSEFQYVVAVNGMDMGQGRNLGQGLGCSSANNLDELDGSHSELETSRAETDFVGVSTSPFSGFNVSSSSAEAFQPILSDTNARALGSNCLNRQVMHYAESNLQSVQYDYHTPSHLSPTEGVVHQQHFTGNICQEKSFDGQVLGAGNIAGTNMQFREEKLKVGNPVYQGSESNHLPANGCVSSLRPSNCNMKGIPVEKATVMSPKLDGELPLQSLKEGKHQEPIRVASPFDTNATEIPNFNANDYTESGTNNSNYFEPSVPSQRVFQSERIPREQVELLNRLSKSDDSHAAQFLVTQSSSDMTNQDLITEAGDGLKNGNLEMRMVQLLSSENPLSTDSQIIENGSANLQKIKQAVADSVIMGDGGGNQGLPSDNEIKCSNHGEKLLTDDMDEVGLGIADVNRLDYEKCHIPEIHSGEKVGNEALIGVQENSQPSDWSGSLMNNVDHGETSSGISRSEQPDILIDINDRFSRDFLSDIFSKAILADSSSNITPLQKDGNGLSLNIENHEPKHWSFFQKLAGNDFSRKDVSLMDQDHIGYSAGLPKIEEETSGAYGFEALTKAGTSINQVNCRNFAEDGQNEPLGIERGDAAVSHSDYGPSHLQTSEGMHYGDFTDNRRLPDSEYEVYLRWFLKILTNLFSVILLSF